MPSFPKPVVVVSKCLRGAKCRYDAQVIQDGFLEGLRHHVQIKAVCPEMEIGLSCPRPPIRVVATRTSFRIMQPQTGRDLTIRMAHFARRFLGGLKHVDGFVLKTRSPSCGLRDTKHYPNKSSGEELGRGMGLFASSILTRYEHLPVEDDERLSNVDVRKRFVARLFASAALRRAMAARSLKALSAFHGRAKRFLNACSKTGAARLDKILANPVNAHRGKVLEVYEAEFHNVLKRIQTTTPRFPGAPVVTTPKQK